MSTPFPLEEAQQSNDLRPTWNPWNGPAEPRWYAGMGFDEDGSFKPFDLVEKGALSGVAKGQAVLGGLLHQSQGIDYDVDSSGGLVASPSKEPPDNTIANSIEADAREKVKRFTPDPTTVGAAGQLLHGLVSGATEMTIGGAVAGPAGAAAVVGGSEGYERYNELIDAGVDPETARKAAAITGVASGAGAILPAGVGSSIATKLASGAAGNTIFGIGSRYADHQILESAGYPEMAAQQKVIDSTQVLTDLILGAAFGGLAHLHAPEIEELRNAPGARDAALTANIAIRDRDAAPGVAADPEAANAHQTALESSIADLMQGKQVDVSDSGVTEAKFLKREEALEPEVAAAVHESITEHGLFGEDNERDVQAFLEGREPESVKLESPEGDDGYTVGEQELTDEQLKAFQGLRSDVSPDEELGGSRGGESGQSGHQDDGRSGEQAGEPLTVYRGADRELTAEHFGLDALGYATGHPSSGLGVFFSKDRAEAARYGQVTEHHLDIRNPKVVPIEDLPGFDSTREANDYREKLRAQGHDGMVIDASHLGGPVNYVAFEPHQVLGTEKTASQPKREPVAKPTDPVDQALLDHPGLTIPDENGNPVSAHEALSQAQESLATEKRESQIAAQAAITCYMRRGN